MRRPPPKLLTACTRRCAASRVVVPGFDEKFNAITGLNGSGKSNILDSICFVLGIQNLQQVRTQEESRHRLPGQQQGLWHSGTGFLRRFPL